MYKTGSPTTALQWESWQPTTNPTTHSVTVAVEYAALNWADLLMIEGRYQDQPDLPFVPGREICGTVLKVPKDSAFQTGDRIVAYMSSGAFASQAEVPSTQIWPQPTMLSAPQAAGSIVTWSSAWCALFARAQLQAGQSVLIHAGSGGLGQAAISLAKRAGARVLATAGSPDKVARCLAAGADAAFDYRAAPFDPWVMDETGGKGVDLVLESVGGRTLDDSIRCLSFAGCLVIAGFSSGEIPAIRANRIMLRHISLTGLNWPALLQQNPQLIQRAWTDISAAFAQGLRPEIGKMYALRDLPQALAALRARQTQGKLILDVGEQA